MEIIKLTTQESAGNVTGPSLIYSYEEAEGFMNFAPYYDAAMSNLSVPTTYGWTRDIGTVAYTHVDTNCVFLNSSLVDKSPVERTYGEYNDVAAQAEKNQLELFASSVLEVDNGFHGPVDQQFMIKGHNGNMYKFTLEDVIYSIEPDDSDYDLWEIHCVNKAVVTFDTPVYGAEVWTTGSFKGGYALLQIFDDGWPYDNSEVNGAHVAPSNLNYGEDMNEQLAKEILPGYRLEITSDTNRGSFSLSFGEKDSDLRNRVEIYIHNSDESNAEATVTNAPIEVDGEKVTFEAYNISGNNFFKLRDIAYVLNGTDKAFGVEWDGIRNAINLTDGDAYEAVGGELSPGSGSHQSAQFNINPIYVDGVEAPLLAFTINGNNFFKLRSLAETFDFGVYWDSERGTVVIDTSSGYDSEQ